MMNEHTSKLLTLPPYMHNSQFYTQSLLFLLLMTRFMIRKCSDMPGCIFSSFFLATVSGPPGCGDLARSPGACGLISLSS